MSALEGSIQLLVKTAAQFAAANTILLSGQVGVESDDLLTTPKFKIGNGSTAWNSLPYAGSAGLSGLTQNRIQYASNSTTLAASNLKHKAGGVDLITGKTLGLDGANVHLDFGTTASPYWELGLDAIGAYTKPYIYGDEASGIEMYGPSGSTQFNMNADGNFLIQATGNYSVQADNMILQTGTDLNIVDETASTIAHFDANKKVKSLALATYPSLTELSYVKGLSSAIQTQLDSKGVGDNLNILQQSGAYRPNIDILGDTTGLYFTGAGWGTGDYIVVPYAVTKSHSIDRLRIFCTTNAVGGKCRIGVYNVSSDVPSSLIADSGEIDCSTTGTKDATVSASFTAGTKYMLAIQFNNNSVGVRYLRNSPALIHNPSDTLHYIAFTCTGTFGAMPSNFSVSSATYRVATYGLMVHARIV